MSRLFLMRHARAGTGPTDAERPLTEEGRSQARAQGSVLANLRDSGALVACSPALRCRETAELLGLGSPAVDDRLGLDRPLSGLVEFAREAPAESLLVGHQPELQGLMAALLPSGAGQPFLLPPATLVGLSLGGGSAWLVLYLEAREAAGLDAGPHAK